jgi:hypothetical protein
MTVVSLGMHETPLEFIRRNGPTLTHEIALRFGMDQREALKVMKGLQRSGQAKSRRVAFDYGAGLEWTIADSGAMPFPTMHGFMW